MKISLEGRVPEAKHDIVLWFFTFFILQTEACMPAML